MQITMPKRVVIKFLLDDHLKQATKQTNISSGSTPFNSMDYCLLLEGVDPRIFNREVANTEEEKWQRPPHIQAPSPCKNKGTYPISAKQ